MTLLYSRIWFSTANEKKMEFGHAFETLGFTAILLFSLNNDYLKNGLAI